MKKISRSILFWTIIFILIILFSSIVLNMFNYQFLNWIKYITMIIGTFGIIAGTIQLLKKKKILCSVLCVLEFIIIGGACILFIFLFFNVEEIVVKDNTKMIKETHSFLFSNWINYYEYNNIFVRSKQPRIYEAHDDYIGDYLYTTYYDENGNIIKEIKEENLYN